VGTPTGPFHEAPGVRQSGIGFSDNAVDSLDPQFAHLNAVFLAVGSWFGDTRLLLIPQLLMSGALVMLYALGARLGRPIGGAAAALALAVSYPFVYVARDAYSEPIALGLLLSGRWALTFVRRSGVRAGLIAGALLGATCMARIDGYIPLIPIAGIIALEWQLARRRDDARAAAGYVAAFGAVAVTASLGAYDVWAFSRAYYDSNLGPRIALMVAGIITSTVIGSLAGRYLFRAVPTGETPRSAVRWVFGGVATAVVAFLAWARFVRPDFAGLEHAMNSPGHVADLLPWAKTLSYLWLEWYLGPLLVAVSFAALIWMTGRGLFEESRVWLPTAAVGFATTLLYLY
jgi:4-amino-4-deoxy-L-arabinose transferase-like glycosyltransferase